MKKGFTLAETLITLGIIGVVAALTIPIIIEKHQEHITVAKVKKFYSTMNQALLYAINENGTIKEWDFDNTNKEIAVTKFFEYLRPYLKISKDCKTSSGCIADEAYKYLNNSQQTYYNKFPKYYKLILADGSCMWLRVNIYNSKICSDKEGSYTDTCGLVWIDVNGELPPNTFGKDTFVFAILENKIVPSNNDICKIGNSGWGCAGYILQNGNMKYLHK